MLNLTSLIKNQLRFKISARHLPWIADRSNLKYVHHLFEDDRKRFENTFPVVVSSLISDNDQLRSITNHFKKMLECNVPHGKKQRGLLTTIAYNLLAKNPTERQLFEACIVGWSLELFQASCLMADDIMDNSLVRRGKPCWHIQKGVGLSYAINDLLFMENGAYKILHDYLSHQSYYSSLVNFIRKVAFQTIHGQMLDLFYTKNQLDYYTNENYQLICCYKTSLYTFYAPVVIAMIMTGYDDHKLQDEVKNILLKIGLLFQMQDDYLDCFGDPRKTGKISRDIQEGKCTWLVTQAVNLLNKEELGILKSWYGKDDPQLVQLVINKYRELKLDELFWEQSEDLLQSVSQATKQLAQKSFQKQIFDLCLKSLHTKNRLQSILLN